MSFVVVASGCAEHCSTWYLHIFPLLLGMRLAGLRVLRNASNTAEMSMRGSELLSLLSNRIPSVALHTSASSARNVDEYPFHAWRVPELKYESRRLGLAVSKPKTALVNQLRAFYAANPHVTFPRAPPSTATLASQPDSSEGFEVVQMHRAHQTADSSVEELTSNFVSAKLTRERPKKSRLKSFKASKAVSSSASDTASDSEAAPALDAGIYSSQANAIDIPLTDAIRADAQLYRRVLLLEPIPLDELMGLAQRAGVLSGIATKDRACMRTWLDTQGICFYEAEL